MSSNKPTRKVKPASTAPSTSTGQRHQAEMRAEEALKKSEACSPYLPSRDQPRNGKCLNKVSQ